MTKFIIFLGEIAFLAVMTACSGLNKETIQKDAPLLEEMAEDAVELKQNHQTQQNPKPKKRKKHRPGDHLILDKLKAIKNMENLA